MAIRLECDGACGGIIALHPRDARHGDGCRACQLGHEGHARGFLDAIVYCGMCVKIWDVYTETERAERLKAVNLFEHWRRQARAVLRTQLARLPDDWDRDVLPEPEVPVESPVDWDQALHDHPKL